MKCDICGHRIDDYFLDKILGTIIKDEKGKKKYICPDCQKKFSSKEDMLKNLK